MLKILVADDHALLREGLARVLTKEFNGLEIQEVGTGQGVLDFVRSHQWDVLILDDIQFLAGHVNASLLYRILIYLLCRSQKPSSRKPDTSDLHRDLANKGHWTIPPAT